MMTRLGNLLILIGIAAFVAATAWWIAFFYDILGGDFQVARECFYWTTELCVLKDAVGLFSDVPVYQPELLWASGVLFAAGLSVRLYGLSKA